MVDSLSKACRKAHAYSYGGTDADDSKRNGEDHDRIAAREVADSSAGGAGCCHNGKPYPHDEILRGAGSQFQPAGLSGMEKS
jgi:hypothetical protein